MRGAIRQVVQTRTRFRVCDEAGDGHTAIQKATDYRCDLVLLDIGMPQPDGVETAAALRRVLPNTKIVGLSMLSKEIGEKLVAQEKFDAFLSKPRWTCEVGGDIELFHARTAHGTTDSLKSFNRRQATRPGCTTCRHLFC